MKAVFCASDPLSRWIPQRETLLSAACKGLAQVGQTFGNGGLFAVESRMQICR